MTADSFQMLVTTLSMVVYATTMTSSEKTAGISVAVTLMLPIYLFSCFFFHNIYLQTPMFQR